MKLDEARDQYQDMSMTERWAKVNRVKPSDHKNVRKAAREELEMLIEEMADFKHFKQRARRKMRELRDCDTSE